jgi:1,4-dihydroxy-2-naphthoate octaprenyltransferase
VICPVLVGTTIAFSLGHFNPWIFVFTLLTGVAIQISTNFCNDYFDYIKGADTKQRKGPLRVTQSGLIPESTMKRACAVSLITTALLGIVLVWHGGWLIALLVAISLVLAVGYTAGPVPLAYKGLGDLFVFIAFGPVACLGCYYLQTSDISFECNVAGLALGALSTAILAVNNIRDIEEDEKSGKRTLVVRFGIIFGKMEYAIMLFIPSIISLALSAQRPLLTLSLLYLIPAGIVIKNVIYNTNPSKLNSYLGKTGALLFVYTALFCIGWLAS